MCNPNIFFSNTAAQMALNGYGTASAGEAKSMAQSNAYFASQLGEASAQEDEVSLPRSIRAKFHHA